MAICATCGQETVAEFRFCPECGAPAEHAASDGVRKTVSVVFCDLVGSTALGESTDPEAVRALLGRYFARMRSIVERHGGTVEKFIGDRDRFTLRAGRIARLETIIIEQPESR